MRKRTEKSHGKEHPSKDTERPKMKPPSALIFWLPLILLWFWIWQDFFNSMSVTQLPYSDFKKHLAQKEVVEVTLMETEITGVIEPEPEKAASPDKAPEDAKPKQINFRTVRVEDPDLIKELTSNDVRFTAVRLSFLSRFIWAWMLPIAFIFLLWSFLARRLSNTGTSLLSIGKSKARLSVDKDTGVTFDDVAGCEEAKHELEEVVDFLKSPARYEALGAKIPKGVLLVGPPGTGKTLLARAVAGEAEVPFFSIAGSDFVEMFVGVGAARVRDLFADAKKRAPCIIFIDEIDAIGRHRSVHASAVNDEREQTLNQLLSELDGFEPNAGVIVLAATNRPEVLDPALLRPGRFDRQVVIDAPDLHGREAILKVHAKGKPLAKDVDLHKIAQATPGFSGADLANMLNEAALLATRRAHKKIAQQDLDDAIEKVLAGPERKSRRLGEKEKKRVAYHETGHAVVAAFCPDADPVRKISIVPRGKAALGYTWQLPETEQFLLTYNALMDRLRGLLGGRAAEELVFAELSTGAENDLEKATVIAEQMVCMYGMGKRIGFVHFGEKRPLYLMGGPGEQLQKNCSPETARLIDEEVKAILDEAYQDASQILKTHRRELDLVAEELVKREAIDGEEFKRLLQSIPSVKEKSLGLVSSQ